MTPAAQPASKSTRKCNSCNGHVPTAQTSGAHIAPNKSVCFGPIEAPITLRLPNTPAMRSLLRDLAVHAVEDDADAIDVTPERVEACESFDAAVIVALGGVA